MTTQKPDHDRQAEQAAADQAAAKREAYLRELIDAVTAAHPTLTREAALEALLEAGA